MRWVDIFRISARMLRTNSLRSLLTILGIGVAISLIVSLIGLGYGLQNITIGSIVESKTLLSIDVTPINQESPQLTQQIADEIKTIPGIKDVTPVVTTTGEITLNNQLASIAVNAAQPPYLEMEGVAITDGNVFTEGATEIVVSPPVLELLDLSPAGIVGATANLSYTDPNNNNISKKLDNLTIVGVSDAKSASIYLPYSLLAKSGADTPVKMSLIKATANDRDSLVSARDAIQAKGFVAETLVDTLDQARTVFRWVTFGLALFGTIALVVAAIGMFNTLTISLLERTREIGIMKAIGVTDKTVHKLFLTEAGLIGFMGGLSGIGIGLVLDKLLGLLLNQIAVRYGGVELTLFQYPTGFLLSMVVYPIILALVTGFYPAIRAARLNPLNALRYE